MESVRNSQKHLQTTLLKPTRFGERQRGTGQMDTASAALLKPSLNCFRRVFTRSKIIEGRSFYSYLRLGIFADGSSLLLLVEIWFGLFYLRLQFGFVFCAYGGNLVWSSLLTVPPPLSGTLCNLVSKSPQNMEKIAWFPGGEKCVESCHVSGCSVLYWSRLPSVPKTITLQHLICGQFILGAVT